MRLGTAAIVSDLRQRLHGTKAVVFAYKILNLKYPIQRNVDPRYTLFLGDSITQLWAVESPSFFSSNPFVNGGVGGQTSQQLRQCFRQRIIDHAPRIVHLICGINDIAENNGFVSDRQIISNISYVVRYCKARDIEVILGSITPVTEIPWNKALAVEERISRFNSKIKSLCEKGSCFFIDYFDLLTDRDGRPLPGILTDGVHLSQAAYARMEPAMLDHLERICPRS